ncbi:MAG TPA: lytic transglycosylase domain-containing protein [Pseudolabrys sp.]|nr:lytic transglycosylase domain-containing protein [Pseudolabrys sp.]
MPVPFFIRLLFQESRFKPGVVSRAGAQGIAQFMPETSESVGLDNPFDPLEAIPASARLLRDLLQQFGNLGLAAAAYNAGPRRIQEWLAKKAKLPEETKGYVEKITGKPVETWTVATAGVPAIKLPPRAPCQDAAGLMAWDGPDTIPTPPPSPRTLARIASHEEAEARANKKHVRQSGHKIAANKSDASKPESGDKSKVAADQLAARRQRGANPSHGHKHKREDLAAE